MRPDRIVVGEARGARGVRADAPPVRVARSAKSPRNCRQPSTIVNDHHQLFRQVKARAVGSSQVPASRRTVLKTVVRKHPGFESLSLRQAISAGQTACAVSEPRSSTNFSPRLVREKSAAARAASRRSPTASSSSPNRCPQRSSVSIADARKRGYHITGIGSRPRQAHGTA